jgi:hypothetical protein
MRSLVAALTVALACFAAPAAAQEPDPEEEPASPLAHRLRVSLGWAFYPGGAVKADLPPAPVRLTR